MRLSCKIHKYLLGSNQLSHCDSASDFWVIKFEILSRWPMARTRNHLKLIMLHKMGLAGLLKSEASTKLVPYWWKILNSQDTCSSRSVFWFSDPLIKPGIVFLAIFKNNWLLPPQVLCDDHGLFLEIAQLIRRLDLAILKGTLENRSNNTWAHFVVEVQFYQTVKLH